MNMNYSLNDSEFEKTSFVVCISSGFWVLRPSELDQRDQEQGGRSSNKDRVLEPASAAQGITEDTVFVTHRWGSMVYMDNHVVGWGRGYPYITIGLSSAYLYR